MFILFIVVLFVVISPPRTLYSFPTRRSSDLAAGEDRKCSKHQPDSKLHLILHARTGREMVTPRAAQPLRSEEHTSELQSRVDLVCRLLLEKKNYGSDYPTDCL